MILIATPGEQAYFSGSRFQSDSSAAVVLANAFRRPTGMFGTNATLVEIRNGPDHTDQCFVIDTAGNVVTWAAFVSGRGESGAVTVDSQPYHYLQVQGRIAEDKRAWYVDSNGVRVHPPNGALHGELSIQPSVFKEAGFVFQCKNGSRTDGVADRNEWFYVDSRMGFGQRNGWPYEQFPGEDTLIMLTDSEGGVPHLQHHYGALESTLYWATNRTGYGALHWHAKLPEGGPNDGGYGMLVYAHETIPRIAALETEVADLKTQIAALETRLTNAGL
jgi:hypothetical protein